MDFLLTSPFSPPFFPLFLSHSAFLSSHLLPDCTHVLPSTARKKRRRKRREKASGFRPHSIPPSPLFTIPSFPYRCLAFSCPSLVASRIPSFVSFFLFFCLVSSFLSLLFFHLLFLSASSSSLTQVSAYEKKGGEHKDASQHLSLYRLRTLFLLLFRVTSFTLHSFSHFRTPSFCRYPSYFSRYSSSSSYVMYTLPPFFVSPHPSLPPSLPSFLPSFLPLLLAHIVLVVVALLLLLPLWLLSLWRTRTTKR